MSTTVMSYNGHPAHDNIKDFLLTSLDDINKLPKLGIEGTLDVTSEPYINKPVAYGSSAIVKDGGEIYTFLLFPDNEWTEI